jgi:glutamine amidotransferase
VIAVVDYGAGNLTSVLKGIRAAGGNPELTSAPDGLAAAAAVVIPGVGHFAATQALDARMRQALLAYAAGGRPVLGICLGLQFLFDGSTEAPGIPGLGLLRGECTLLPTSPGRKVPHVGWNSLAIRRASPLLDGLDDGAQVYFTHSYAAPVTEATVATTEHGAPFAAAVEHVNVFGVQFHPEKSSEAGLRILRSFVQISKSC